MNKALMEAVVGCVLFFELSDDTVVDPDAAVQQLEQIAFSLQQLSAVEKNEFTEYVRMLASQAEREGQTRRYQCVIDLPEALGLTTAGE